MPTTGTRVTRSLRRALLLTVSATVLSASSAAAKDWTDYVPAPKSATPEPVRIFKTSGDVKNPEALVAGGKGTATLSSPVGGPKATIVFDFGQEVGGTPQVSVGSVVPDASGPPQFSLGWSEASTFVLNAAGDPAVDQPMVGSPTTQPALPGVFVGPPVGGFRYFAVQLLSGTVELSDVNVRFGAYRATADKYQGHFLSSSEDLNRLWYAGAYTAHMDMAPAGSVGTSATTFPVVQRFDSVLDGAKRDRAIWTGDLLVTDPLIQLSVGTNGDSYIKSSLQHFLDAQDDDGRFASAADFPFVGINFNYANTYSAYLADAVIDFYRRSGDRAFIDAALPKLEKATAYHATLLNEHGLIVSNDNDYWQTAQNGEVTEYSLVYVELLQQMSWLERSLGRNDQAADYDARAAKVAAAINERLWNAEAGAYQQSDTSKAIMLDANANAIRFGVAPRERIPSILRVLRNGWTPYGARISTSDPKIADPGGHEIEPLNNAWEMEARLRSGDDAGALELLHRLYDQQLDPKHPAHTGTTWEYMDDDGEVKTGFVSLAHGWGAGGTLLLSEYVLGVRPTGPGYSTFDVDPHPIDLDWAEGQIPTPKGPIKVRWDRGPSGLSIKLDVPPGTTAHIVNDGLALQPGAHQIDRAKAPQKCIARRIVTVRVARRSGRARIKIGSRTVRRKIVRHKVQLDLRKVRGRKVTARITFKRGKRTVTLVRRYTLCK